MRGGEKETSLLVCEPELLRSALPLQHHHVGCEIAKLLAVRRGFTAGDAVQDRRASEGCISAYQTWVGSVVVEELSRRVHKLAKHKHDLKDPAADQTDTIRDSNQKLKRST